MVDDEGMRLQQQVCELEGEVDAARSEASHLRKRFQGAVEDAAMANASVQSLERTVRLLRKNQSQGPSESTELRDLRADLEATR
jgi:predicted RNase H-like nuclease (RuvC/YqgF family)